MKQHVNFILAIITGSFILGGYALALEPEIKELRVGQSYPFGLLANMAEKIEIKYESNNNSKIYCSTVTFYKEQTWASEPKYVSQKDFGEDPLKACLTRQKAKDILKNIFE